MNLNRTSSPAVDAPVPALRSTPERVLDTAAALFWEKGYAATTTREIAAAVGIQQASLYYHVASKEGLLYQLCVSSMEQLLADVEGAVEQPGDSLDRLRALIGAHLSTLLKHQVRHVTMLTELRALSKRHHAEVLARRKRYANRVRGVIQEGQVAGKIRTDIPSKYLYLALLNMLNWAVVWFRRDQGLGAEELAELFWPIYRDGALAAGVGVAVGLPNLTNHPRGVGPKGQGAGRDGGRPRRGCWTRRRRYLRARGSAPPARGRSRRCWGSRGRRCTITSGARRSCCTRSRNRRWSRSGAMWRGRSRRRGSRWSGSGY